MTRPPSNTCLTRRQRAFALVLVLAFLALMMVVLAALLNVTQSESQVMHTSAESSRARRMAENVVALATGQLRLAIEPAANATSSKIWTSQPGAIRVHRATGELDTLYKLYSAANMMVEDEADLAADVPPANWQTRGDEFVDLNAPEQGLDGLRFPIIDPRAMSEAGGDPVEGFSYETENAPAGTVSSIKVPDAMRLPMPVRWIYMLQDGTLGTLDADRRFTAQKASETPGGNPQPVVPDKSNPIVARFAYWMDDESCKINVNTAAEGAFWDTPRADTPQERQLAVNQPTRLEYHRQPGHPAGVCLSSFLLPGRRFHPSGFQSRMTPMSQDSVEDLWRIGRLWVAEQDSGTSEGGMTFPTLLASMSVPRPRVRQQRYTEVNEIIFDDAIPPGGLAQNPGAMRRTPQPFFSRHPEALNRLRQGGGFLTAHSAAPEVTLYGTPRITLWPVHQNTPMPGAAPTGDDEFRKYTAYDSAAVLASTLKDQRYLIQRAEPGNGAMDMDIHSGGQNKKLLNYLRTLTDKPVPGWVGAGNNSFAAKYGADPVTGDRDSILISMLDYVRSTNFADGQLKPNTQFSILCPGPGQEYHGFGQVSPLQNRVTGQNMALSDHARGPGRVMTVSEVALVILCRAEAYLDENGELQVRGEPTKEGRDAMRKAGDREYEAGLVVEGFLPTQGWTDYRPFTSIALVGGAPGGKPDSKAAFPPVKLNGKPLVRSKQTPAVMEAIDDVPARWRGWGGTLGTRALSKGALSLGSVVLPAKEGPDLEPPDLTFEGAANDTSLELKLCVYDSPTSAAAVSSSAADLLHIIPLRLPDIMTNPDSESDAAELRLSKLPVMEKEGYGLAARQEKAAVGTQPLLMPEDIVQSLLPVHADYRLLSARRWLESRDGGITLPLFVAHPQWGKRRHAHSLQDPLLYAPNTMPAAALANSFIPDLLLAASQQPDFPHSAGNVVQMWLGSGWSLLSPRSASDRLRLDGGVRGSAWPDLTGDFDNGVGNCPDGAYTARPDDGNWAATLNTGNSGSLPYFDPDAFSQTGHTVPPVTGAGFSAQRMIPSPVAFGSLPTGVRTHVPWQTLLFRPQPGHYGATNPPDHLLLDLFWSPVIEPEPVSRPFETSGKINLNHCIVPFSHIRRTTALNAVMKAETLMAIPDNASQTYKSPDLDGVSGFRHYLDAEGTLKIWQEAVFDQKKVFLTPGQICEHPLVPEGVRPVTSVIQGFWNTHRLTGDNTKERPYAHLYSRLTTRSNVYRLHFVVETLKKNRTTSPAVFDPAEDKVTARVQGTRLIRRFLNPKNPDLPDYLPKDLVSAPAPAKPLDMFYEWIVEP